MNCSIHGCPGTYELRQTTHTVRHKGQVVVLDRVPVEVCSECGMMYYDAAVLKEIERWFFAIDRRAEQPDRYIQIPEKAYA